MVDELKQAMKLGIIKTTPGREAFFGFIRKLVIFPDNLEAMTCMKRSLLLWLLAVTTPEQK